MMRLDWNESNTILPTEIEGWIGREVGPGVFLITNPRWSRFDKKWTALANIDGALCLIEFTVKIR